MPRLIAAVTAALALCCAQPAFGQDTNVLDHGAILAANHLDQPQWYEDNIPFLDTPDANLNGVYYYRWSTYKRALRYTVPGTGYISSEYDVPIEYASDPYTGLPDAAGYHITDGRWLRDPQYAGDYLNFWLKGAGTSGQRSYSEWITAAAYQRYLVTGNADELKSYLPQMIALYNAWNSNFSSNITVNGQVTDADLYSQSPLSDATEYTETSYKSSNAFTGGTGYRPTVNTYQYAAALAIAQTATLVGDTATADSFKAKAADLKKYVQAQLWDPQRNFFMQVYTNANGNGTYRQTRTTWREAMGFTPWLYELPDPQYSSAWQFLTDPDRFGAPFGPTTLEKWHDVTTDASNAVTIPAPGAGTWPIRVYSATPGLTVAVNGGTPVPVPPASPYSTVNVTLRSGNNTLQFSGAVDKLQENPYFDYQAIPAPNREDQLCCRWDGPSWPYATSMELTGLANLLHDYPAQSYITADDYRSLLEQFATLQHKDGHPYVAETADGDTGRWIYDGMNFSENYNHSSFNDLVLTGLLGIRPQADNTLVLDPLVSPTWDYFAVEDLPYHGHLLTILWDRTGLHYGKGAGLQVFQDGVLISSSALLTKQTIAVGAVKTPSPGQTLMNVASNPNTMDQTWNRKTVTQPYPQAFASFTNPVSNGPHCHSGQTCQPTTFDQPMQATDGWIRYDQFPEDRWTNAGSPNATDYLGVDFGARRQVDEARIYTYDDGDTIRVPQSFDVQYLDANGQWYSVPGQAHSPAAPRANDANEVTFATVTTSQLRVVFTPQPGKFVGVTELESWWPQDAPYRLINKNSGLELGVAGASPTAGGAVTQQPADGSLNHRWTLVPAENGFYKLINANSGLVLGISGASKTAGATALQWGDNLTRDHLWSLGAGDGYYKIVNANSGLVLGIQNASKDAGAVALQFDDNGTDDHLWRLGADTTVPGGGAGGTVPATLSLTLGAAASFGAFVPGVERDYTASTTANVISTAGDATLSVADPGHLANGTFTLPSALQVGIDPSSWSAPVSNGPVAITFKQHIGAADALRTGAYSRTLTFTLSTTTP